MKSKSILILYCLIIGVSMTMSTALAFGEDDRILATGEKGKMVQREMESFLKPKATTPPTTDITTFDSTRGTDPNMVMEKTLATGEYGKMVQRETESFLKPKPVTSEGALIGKELSIPQTVPQISADETLNNPTYFNPGAERWPWLNNP